MSRFSIAAVCGFDSVGAIAVAAIHFSAMRWARQSTVVMTR